MRINLMTTIEERAATSDALPFTAHLPAALDDNEGVRRIYLRVTNTEQMAHAHHFTDHTRFGDAWCIDCGAGGFSAGWVKDGVYGRDTASWIQRQIAWHAEQTAQDVDDVAVHLVVTMLDAEVVEVQPRTVTVVAAVLNEHMPAKVGRERAGLGVPSMPYGVLTVQNA